MVKAWYLDHTLENHRNPPEFITSDVLFKKTGVIHIHMNVDTYMNDGVLDKLKKERGYTYEDEMVCSKESQDYEERIKSFYTEHLHADEEIRLFLDGSGNFDVRDVNDDWIRIAVGAGDLIILPAGIYHRFTLNSDNYVKMKRFFTTEPVWKSYERPADEMTCRKEYVTKLHTGFTAAS